MNKMLLACAAILFFGCNDPEPKAPSVKTEQLVGEWRNVTLRIEMNRIGGKDSVKVFEVDEKNWESRMNIRPIRTFYNADGTYHSVHANLNDSVVYDPAGVWTLQGDSLFMTDTFPARGPRYSYQLKINGNMAEFRGLEDSDGDGEKDDLYFGTQRRQ